MRLSRLTLENFRCFRQQQFDLSADVIVIYGRNGTGKTALFDALEFALTGSIGRFALDQTEIPSQYLANAFVGTGAKIRIEMDSPEPRWLEAQIGNSNGQTAPEIICSDHSRDRKDFFFANLVDDNYSSARKEFEPLVELFRATVLLSQASMRHFVEAPAIKRSSLISNLVGAAYIQRCLEKAGAVIAEGKRRSRKISAELQELLPQVRDFEGQVQERENRLSGIIAAVHGETVTFEQLVESIGQLDASEAPATSFNEQSAEEFAPILEAFCNELILRLRTRLSALTELEAIMPLHKDRVEEHVAVTTQLEQLRADSQEVASTEAQLSEKLRTEQEQATTLQAACDNLGRELGIAIRLEELRQALEQLDAQHASILPRIDQCEQSLNPMVQQSSDLELTLTESRRRIAVKSAEIVSTTSRLSAVEKLNSQLQNYSDNQLDIAAHRSQNLESVGRAATLDVERQRLQIEESTLAQRSEIVSREILAVTSGNVEITEAILKLRNHSSDGHCPLCGHRHASQEELQDQIDKELSKLSTAASRLQREARDIEVARLNVRDKVSALDAELFQLRNKRAEMDRKLEMASGANRVIEEQALRLGVQIERGPMDAHLASLRATVATAEIELLHLQTETREVEQRLSESRAALLVGNERLSAERAALNQLLLRKAETERQISLLESPADTLRPTIESLRLHLEDGRAKHDSKITAIAILQRELVVLEGRRRELQLAISNVEAKLLGLTQVIATSSARLRALDLLEQTTSRQVAEMREATLAKEKKVLALRALAERFGNQQKRVILERERDELRRQHLAILSKEQELRRSQANTEAASTEAETWETKLATAVQNSVSLRLNQHRIESFRLFQSMIPTPYLFDDITVTREERGVKLGLRFRGVGKTVGEPRYFLSSAQANILALSYFLSFARRQSWCKLRTILMDDPVQHLDDLDAVAFLDVVRSLVVSEKKPRQQVIISTCNYNLYALMIRKFTCFSPEKLRFSAISLHDISAKGPNVTYDYGGVLNSEAA